MGECHAAIGHAACSLQRPRWAAGCGKQKPAGWIQCICKLVALKCTCAGCSKPYGAVGGSAAPTTLLRLLHALFNPCQAQKSRLQVLLYCGRRHAASTGPAATSAGASDLRARSGSACSGRWRRQRLLLRPYDPHYAASPAVHWAMPRSARSPNVHASRPSPRTAATQWAPVSRPGCVSTVNYIFIVHSELLSPPRARQTSGRRSGAPHSQ